MASTIINGFEAEVAGHVAGNPRKLSLRTAAGRAERFAASPFDYADLSLPAKKLAGVQTVAFEAPVFEERFYGASGPMPMGRDAYLSNLTGDIVLGYIDKNPVSRSELAELIKDICVALANTDSIRARRSLAEAPEGGDTPNDAARADKPDKKRKGVPSELPPEPAAENRRRKDDGTESMLHSIRCRHVS